MKALQEYTPTAIVIEKVDSITPQLSRPGRVTEVIAKPNLPIKAGEILFKVDPVPYENDVRRGEALLSQSKQDVDLAKSAVELSEATMDRASADLAYTKNNLDRNIKLRKSGAASEDELERARTRYEQAKAAMTQAEEGVKQSKLSIAVAVTNVTQAEIALADARYDLEQTTVIAPADGYVTNLQLRPGMLVGGGTGAVMTFVREGTADQDGVVVATFREKNYLRIKSGQYAEVAMDGYPGDILTGRVLNAIDVSGKGQIAPGGTLPSALMTSDPTLFAVRIKLDDSDLRLPGGARGQAAVYTEDLQLSTSPTIL